MYAVHKLLWDIRREPALADRFRSDPDALLDDYGLTGRERDAMRGLDVKSLYDAGANPYLLYFCALQLGMPRQDYYARIRGERP